MTGFARSLCKNLPILQTEGHPKWRDVELTLPDLGAGWEYYAPVAKVLRSCGAPVARPVAAPPASKQPGVGCSQSERILGLCQAP